MEVKFGWKKILSVLDFVFYCTKIAFVIVSWLLFRFHLLGRFDLYEETIWRDYNEYFICFFVLLLIFEIFRRKLKMVLLTSLCLITGYLLAQSTFPSGTNIEIYFR